MIHSNGLALEQFERFVLKHLKKFNLPVGDDERAISIAAMGLCEEAGEVTGLIKKNIRIPDYKDPDKWNHELLLELGDVLHYLTFIALYHGFTLEQIMKANKEKLIKRWGPHD